MNKIPKCRSKYFIPQANNIKPAPKDSNREHLVPKIKNNSKKFKIQRKSTIWKGYNKLNKRQWTQHL